MLMDKLFSQPDGSGTARRKSEILSRRNLLAGGAALAGLLGKEKTTKAAPPHAQNRFLIDRLTYGWNESEQLLADQLGYFGYLDYHLNYNNIDDSELNQRIGAYYFRNWQPYMLIMVQQSSYVVHQMVECNFLRAVHSKRQLYERMCEFWSDHFNIDVNNSLCPWLKIVDDKNVARANALGMFGDLLLASAKSPAMSMYLNNDTSIVGNQNENYARELMELHTLGVDGGYTQQDVVEVARCFTGWAYYGTDAGTNMLTFNYYDYKHDQGSKVVLGHQIPAGGGMNDALQVLDILLHHPSAAKFIAKKLCKYFYSYSPPQSLIDSVAATFSSTNGDIKQCVQTLFTSCDPSAAPAKLKRPYHLIVSAFRASGADIIDDPNNWNSPLRDQMALCGQPPYSWMTPDGYPDKLDFWGNMLLSRWNVTMLIGSYYLSGVVLDPGAFFAGATGSVAEMVDRINQKISGHRMSQLDLDLVNQYLSIAPTSSSRQKEAIGLALSSPSFQWF